MYKSTMFTGGTLMDGLNYVHWGDDYGDNTIPPKTTYTPYSPDTSTDFTYSYWSWPSKASISVEEAKTLQKAAKKDKKLAAVLRKLTPYIEVRFSLLDLTDED